eukprot:scaffold2912_cov67-Attheya_sp.AAC.1
MMASAYRLSPMMRKSKKITAYYQEQELLRGGVEGKRGQQKESLPWWIGDNGTSLQLEEDGNGKENEDTALEEEDIASTQQMTSSRQAMPEMLEQMEGYIQIFCCDDGLLFGEQCKDQE